MAVPAHLAPVKIVCLCGLDRAPGAKVQLGRGVSQILLFSNGGGHATGRGPDKANLAPLTLSATAPALKRVQGPCVLA